MSKYRVLLVEDQQIDRMTFERHAKEMGLPYDYQMAVSVAEAKKMLKARSFDCIISDYFLGDGTAFDLIEMKTGIPIIVITGTGSEEIAVKAMKMGAYDYLIKDIDSGHLSVLPATVENAVNRKKTETTLRLLHHAIMSAHDSIYITDADGTVIFVNEAFCNAYGYAEKEIVGQKTILFGESSLDGEHIHTRKDGTKISISISRSIIKDETGQQAGIVYVSRDVSERKKIDQMKTDFVSFVSHQLKNPVVEIKGFIDNMLSGLHGPMTDKQKDSLRKMQSVAHRNYRLITDLLNVSKIDEGLVLVNIHPVLLDEVVSASVSEFAPLAERKGLSLSAGPLDKNISILADRDKAVEAIKNIVDNAVKFSEKGEIKIRIWKENRAGFVEIADTGPGIPDEIALKLFTKELALSGKPRPKGGSGLGLYIAKSFLDLQGASISVATEKQKGTVFTLKFPAAR